MKCGSKIEEEKKEQRKTAVGERKELARGSDFGSFLAILSYTHITAVLFPSFSLSLPLIVSCGLLAETERRTAAAAAVETSTLLGCRSCGTGLRELPLEELHSPCVLPRLHVTHIYLRLSMPLLHGRDLCMRVYRHTHTHTHTHAHTYDARTNLQVCAYARAIMSCTVCARRYT